MNGSLLFSSVRLIGKREKKEEEEEEEKNDREEFVFKIV